MIMAVLVYSYYSYKDMGVFKIIKGVMFAIFSEFYLIYQFVQIIILKKERGLLEI